LLALLAGAAHAANWAVLVVGSKGYDNYRHQADMFHLYSILLSKGFRQEHIITMAYNDVASDASNPFPGQVFNSPDESGAGVDVYAAIKDHLDYTGDAVTPATFAGVLLGNGTAGGSGRSLRDTAPDDDVFLFYDDHGAPGVLEFPDGSVLHTEEFQSIVQRMRSENRFGRFLIYIEACNSGSMLEGIPADIGVYGVTAVGPDKPSLGTYCGSEAKINGQAMNTCLGDLFAVYFMRFIVEGDGSRSMQTFFEEVRDGVQSYASLHWSTQVGQQYGDVSGFGGLTLHEFFYPDGLRAPEVAVRLPPWREPKTVYSQPRIEQQIIYDAYTEASALPLEESGEVKWEQMQQATRTMKDKLLNQERVQNVYWNLVQIATKGNPGHRDRSWREKRKARQQSCEVGAHRVLMQECGGRGTDLTTAYALQFHQVVVNLCGDPDLSWGNDLSWVSDCREACRRVHEKHDSDAFVV
jgi:glycosylphosphatidylinositol transamidase (GPIT) subunit GPI8